MMFIDLRQTALNARGYDHASFVCLLHLLTAFALFARQLHHSVAMGGTKATNISTKCMIRVYPAGVHTH
jgi:hypothetical protein